MEACFVERRNYVVVREVVKRRTVAREGVEREIERMVVRVVLMK